VIYSPDYLVVKQKAADAYRRQTGERLTEPSVRAIMMALLRDGETICVLPDQGAGPTRVIRSEHAAHGPCELLLIEGILDGIPQQSPEGGRMFFLTSFRLKKNKAADEGA
jgi:hypothetical protein